MKPRIAIPVLLVATVAWLGLGSCADPDLGEGQANVRVVVQGASEADNVVDVVLWTDGTTAYDFNVVGDVLGTQADFTLDVFLTSLPPATEPIHSVDFSLPAADVDAEDGEHGEGSQRCDIYFGDNTCYIPFVWSPNPPLNGDTNVVLQFSHPPKIIVWSKVPGPSASVTDGTEITVRAEVEFYGDAGTEAVGVRFWDNEAVGGAGGFVGSGGLDYDEGSGLWVGPILAVSGADILYLTASDSDGETTSEASYVVP